MMAGEQKCEGMTREEGIREDVGGIREGGEESEKEETKKRVGKEEETYVEASGENGGGTC